MVKVKDVTNYRDLGGGNWSSLELFQGSKKWWYIVGLVVLNGERVFMRRKDFKTKAAAETYYYGVLNSPAEVYVYHVLNDGGLQC